MPEDQLIQLLQIKQLRAEAGVEPPPMQKGRDEITRDLLVANGGKMHLSKERFSNLLLVCDFIEKKPYLLDRKQDVIILKSELVRPNC